MHPTEAFRHDATELRDRIVAEFGFAMIFLSTSEGPRAAHTPVELVDGNLLRFHLARTNALVPHLASERALAVVNGPESYVSARWYEAASQVPTWNYVAYEFEGPVHRMEDAALPDLLARLSAHHEKRIKDGAPWTMDKMDEKALNALLRGVVGFEMKIETVRETVKLSQNKPADERERLIAGLKGEGRGALASLMREITR
ncbi:MAG: FMN-binding negative transcriptional regulator [Pseudomonadota bacterium]